MAKIDSEKVNLGDWFRDSSVAHLVVFLVVVFGIGAAWASQASDTKANTGAIGIIKTETVPALVKADEELEEDIDTLDDRLRDTETAVAGINATLGDVKNGIDELKTMIGQLR